MCKGCWKKCEGWEDLRTCFMGECITGRDRGIGIEHS